MAKGDLLEALDFTDVEIDEENHVIKGVKVLNEKSKNKRAYKLGARQDIKRLIDRGMKVMYNHGSVDQRETQGELREGYLDGDGVRANWHYNHKHKDVEQLLTDVRKFPRNVCLSAEIKKGKYKGKKNRKGIHEINQVSAMRCVAIVPNGGTTDSIWESEDESMEIRTATELREVGGDLLETVIEEEVTSATKDLQKKHDALVKENERLQGIVDSNAEKEKKNELRASIEKDVAAAGKVIDPNLLEKWIEKEFDGDLLEHSIKGLADKKEGDEENDDDDLEESVGKKKAGRVRKPGSRVSRKEFQAGGVRGLVRRHRTANKE